MLGDTNAKMGKEIWTGTVVGTCDLHDEIMWWCSSLRHRATKRNVADSIPNGVMVIMALESTESPTETSIKNISCGQRWPV